MAITHGGLNCTAVLLMPKLVIYLMGMRISCWRAFWFRLGYSIQETKRISEKMEEAALPLREREELEGKQPKIDSFSLWPLAAVGLLA